MSPLIPILAFVVALLGILSWAIFADVVLSWAWIFGWKISVPLLRRWMQAAYDAIGAYLPVRVAGLDFSPYLLGIACMLLQSLLLSLDPSVALFVPGFLLL